MNLNIIDPGRDASMTSIHVDEDDVAGHLQRSRSWLGVAEKAYEEYHFEQAGVAAAIAMAHAQIATALNR